MQSARTRVSQAVCEDGFTIFEFVAASLILFIVLMGVLGAVQYAGASTQMASMRQGALDVATSQIEYDRNLPWTSLGVQYANGVQGSPGGAIQATQTVVTVRGNCSVQTSVSWVLDSVNSRASYKKLTVKASWASPTAGSLSVETAVYGTGTTANLADVQVTAVDVDNPTTRVPGVTVQINPTGDTAQIGQSQADGTILYSGVKPVKATFTVPSFYSDWLVDVGRMGQVTLSAGFNNVGFLYCQKPCSAVVHVHSGSIANYPGATVTLTDQDRSLTYTAVTDSNGNATFSKDVLPAAPLWKSTTSGYKAVATFGSSTSNTGNFSLTTGGQNYTGLDLLMPDPPSIMVSKKVSSTGAALNGVAWSCTLKNPSGTVVGTYTNGTANSFIVPVSVAGTYTAIVTGVSGFLDNAGFAFYANSTVANQACQVPMSPVFNVAVRLGGVGYPGAKVILQNATTNVVTTSTAGNNPGVTASDGTVGFVIPADGNYNLSAVVNSVTYTAPQQSLVAASPPGSTYVFNLNPSTLTLTVTVPASPSTWYRNVGIWNAAGSLVSTGTVYANSGLSASYAVNLPPGDYYAGAGGGTTHVAPPSTVPSSGTVWSGTYIAPFLPIPKTTLPSAGASITVGPINVQN